MQAVATLIIWMCLGVIALAHNHLEPCQSPNMTGTMAVMSLDGEVKAMGHYSYDHAGKRLRFKDNDTHIDTTVDMDVLMLFGEGVYYDINSKNQSCVKKTLQVASHVFEIPTDAKHMSEIAVGSVSVPGEGYKMNVWVGAVPEKKGRYSMTTSVGKCMPLSIFYFSDSISLLFSNMYVETDNVNVHVDDFTVPAFCDGLEMEETSEGTVNSFFSLFA